MTDPDLHLDPLGPLLRHFNASAQIFFAGTVCGHADYLDADGVSYLHLLRSGALRVDDSTGTPLQLTQPSLIFYPRPQSHTMRADTEVGAELACASVRFEHKSFNPLALALPKRLAIGLHEMPELGSLLDLLFKEAFDDQPGKQQALNRLFELVLIGLLRYSLSKGATEAGLLRGLGHPQVGKVLASVHAAPELNWTLTRMANLSGMSRSSFASTFKAVVGLTPGDYLMHWRVAIAQSLLLKQVPLKSIAERVGYASHAGFLKAFKAVAGRAPTEWLRQTRLQVTEK
ncbi:MAG: AraC family transcriptional regulator [Nevskiaceae bacterium]|jgi:AraC-like DNA-binding protein|nr:MAG: AraC family transcriptional regulator [Nevskiaceae bacterium]